MIRTAIGPALNDFSKVRGRLHWEGYDSALASWEGYGYAGFGVSIRLHWEGYMIHAALYNKLFGS